MTKKTATAVKQKAGNKKQKDIRLEQQLVLQQWILELFGVDSFHTLVNHLKSQALERFDENNVSLFHSQLCIYTPESHRPHLPDSLLLSYDQNIVRHWRQIAKLRNIGGASLYPKYFQYIPLLFTEIYLDKYFQDADGLLNDLNEYLQTFCSDKGIKIDAYTKQDLNKLAFWMATGSGKTLLMHANILQYQYYLKKHRRQRELNRIILLTPNEGLSYQHCKELQLSGIPAELFSKDGYGIFTGQLVEIIDIHKLRDKDGDKTIAVDSFEGNNLVLVDEGHRGTSSTESGTWIQNRNKLCEKGFSFEYSATFGQAVKASSNRSLEQTYAKCIIFDYSYKYFYSAGYGKEYRILNLANDSEETFRQKYLTACLLTFYQQLKLYNDKTQELKQFLIDRPLWIFVGGSVNAVRSENKHKVSDVVDILLFLASFVSKRHHSVKAIEDLLKGNTGLMDSQGLDIFSHAFPYLKSIELQPDDIFEDILQLLFNASSSGALHVEDLKSTDGEIALRLGDNKPFGVINVGDTSTLCKLCGNHKELIVTDKAFSDSLFHSINDESSTINVLIGSKKFTEGWSSWRVSTMGLMNIGKNEGSQIIQLFGRGVRLKGKDFSLKRSERLEHIKAPKHIQIMETLNVFGVRSNYMQQFQVYLEAEGLSGKEKKVEFILPVVKNLGGKNLKILKIKNDADFKKEGQNSTIGKKPAELFIKHPVSLDWYPKLQSMISGESQKDQHIIKKDKCFLEESHLAFLDWDTIYLDLIQYKNERGWHKLTIPRESVISLMENPDWYHLYISKEAMRFRSFEQVLIWQEVATALLKKYIDRYYKLKKQEFESSLIGYQILSVNDPNVIDEYEILVDPSQEGIIEDLNKLIKSIENKKLKNINFGSLHAISFDHSLYSPIIGADSSLIEVKPVVLENEGEREFVEDLQKFCQSKQGTEFLEGKDIYLLRNMSRGRGIGFFEAGNFYPDFILWILVDNHQYVSFVDPKGLRNLEGPKDPKIQFYKTIKDLELQLNTPDVTLNSFIVSKTPLSQVQWWDNGMTEEKFESMNVLFMDRKDPPKYIESLLKKAINAQHNQVSDSNAI